MDMVSSERERAGGRKDTDSAMLHPYGQSQPTTCASARRNSRFLSNLVDRCSYFLCHAGWQRCIVQGWSDALTGGEHPVKEVHDDLFFVLVLPLRRYQQPGETRNWIGGIARSVGDGDSEIGRHLLH